MSALATPKVLENYVGGRFAASGSERALDVLDPAAGDVLGRVPLSTAAEVDAAVAAARAALPGWRATSVIRRARVLFALRDRLLEHADELARTVTLEMGKTLDDARAEVARAIEMVECACAVPTTMQGRNLEDVATGVDCETFRQPVGVCAAIAPFNFPAMVPFWFLPFAIACGNTFILKPSEQVPLTQARVFELLDGLGLPPGVVNLVHGDREVVDALLDHPGVDAVSFVGSAPVARHVYSRAAASGKRVQALGGAKNHLVVMADAVLDRTVDGLLTSAFGAAGQRCMAGSVLVTVGDAHERVLPRLVETAAALRVGPGSEPGVGVGPVVSPAARERIEAGIADAIAAGATPALDGRGVGEDGSAYVGPTILTDVAPDAEVVRTELFGPVLAVVPVATLADAIALINASPFGNGASLFTENAAAVRRFRHDVEAGMLGINVGVAAPVAFFPFSGWKASFLGDLHAHGPDAIEFYTRKKTITSRYFGDGDGARLFGEH